MAAPIAVRSPSPITPRAIPPLDSASGRIRGNQHRLFKAAPRWYQGVFKAAYQFLGSAAPGAFPLPMTSRAIPPQYPASGRIRGHPHEPHGRHTDYLRPHPGGTEAYLKSAPQFLGSSDPGAFPIPHKTACDTPGVFKAAPRWYQGVFKAVPQFLGSAARRACPSPIKPRAMPPHEPHTDYLRPLPAVPGVVKAAPGGTKAYFRPPPGGTEAYLRPPLSSLAAPLPVRSSHEHHGRRPGVFKAAPRWYQGVFKAAPPVVPRRI